jgi:hypothetical protein
MIHGKIEFMCILLEKMDLKNVFVSNPLAFVSVVILLKAMSGGIQKKKKFNVVFLIANALGKIINNFLNLLN